MNYPECSSKCLWMKTTDFLLTEAERLTKIVDNFPKTADGTPVIVGETRVFFRLQLSSIYDGIVFLHTIGINRDANHVRVVIERNGHVIGDQMVRLKECYSTVEALLKAEKEEEN